MRGDRHAEVLVENVDDGAGSFVTDSSLGTDAREFVDPVSLAGLLFPDREQCELSMGTPVFRGVLDGDRDEKERRVAHIGIPQRQVPVRREARHSLRPVDDAGYPIKRDGLREVQDPEPARRHQYALPPAIHCYRATVEEQYEQLRQPRCTAADSVALHLDIGSDMQWVHGPG